VEDFTLEDVLKITGYVPPKNAKNKNRLFTGRSWRDKQMSWDDVESEEMPDSLDANKQMSNVPSSKSLDIPMEELIKRVKEDDIDYNIIGTLVRHLLRNKAEDDDGSILVFLPGAQEIKQAELAIDYYAKGLPKLIIQLHGGIQPIEQQRIFTKPPKGTTKVILSTNIAETSITIPDCTVVIDTCREKQSSFDPSNRMPILAETFSAKDSLRQRRGRAGRVRRGRCYKMISLNTLLELPNHSEPEIKRCALDQTILSLLFLGLDDGNGSFLSKLLDPPEDKAIKSATFSLEKLCALKKSFKGEYPVWELTPLGMHLAGIPAPPSIGKRESQMILFILRPFLMFLTILSFNAVLVMGSLLGCRSFSLAMASSMSVTRSPILKIEGVPVNRGTDDYLELKNEKIMKERAKEFEQVGCSDIAFLAHLFLRWTETREKKEFCDTFGLSIPGMNEMKQLYNQLDISLNSVGFNHNEQSNKSAKSWRLIRSCIVSALAPNQLVRVERAAAKYAETAEGSLEVEGSAKELRFFIRGSDKSTSRNYHEIAEERVFIHPSSMNFSVSSYSCPWLVYNDLVRTSKAFIRDATECSAYALLLFGGDIKVEASKNLILVDGYVRLSANARIGALIGGLRRKIDDILSQKVANPNFDISSSVEMKLIVQLIVGDGL
jgi:ATP-dependent RNA helicase DHX57